MHAGLEWLPCQIPTPFRCQKPLITRLSSTLLSGVSDYKNKFSEVLRK